MDNKHSPRVVRLQSLAFGVSSAHAIFGRVIENLLADISDAVVYLNNILVTSASEEG